MPNVYVVPRNKLLALLAKLFPAGPQGIPCVNDCTCAAPAPSKVERPVDQPNTIHVVGTNLHGTVVEVNDVLSGGWVVCGPKTLAYDMLASVLPNDVRPFVVRRIDHQSWVETFHATWSWRGQKFGVEATQAEDLRNDAHRLMLRVDMTDQEWELFQGWDKAKQ